MFKTVQKIQKNNWYFPTRISFVIIIYLLKSSLYQFTQFLPSIDRVDTAIWMHYIDAN